MPLYISIDGIDGTGKSTQIKRLASWLLSKGRMVTVTREPGGTQAGEAIRSILVNKGSQLCPDTELLLFCADRAEHQGKVASLLAAGHDVICDRSLASTWAYQIFGRGLDSALLEIVTAHTVHTQPDLTIIMDMDVSTALARSLERLKAEGKEIDEGRFEAEKEDFFRRVQEGFRWFAGQSSSLRAMPSQSFGRCALVSAEGSVDEVFANIIKEVEACMEIA